MTHYLTRERTIEESADANARYIEEGIELAQRVAGRFHRQFGRALGLLYEDMRGEAYVALSIALDQYKAGETTFAKYASTVIYNALISFLRRESLLVRFQQGATDAEAYSPAGTYVNRGGRRVPLSSPSAEPDPLARLEVEDEVGHLLTRLDDVQGEASQGTWILNDAQWYAVASYFGVNSRASTLTQAEIAADLGLTQARVSQILAEALGILRAAAGLGQREGEA